MFGFGGPGNRVSMTASEGAGSTSGRSSNGTVGGGVLGFTGEGSRRFLDLRVMAVFGVALCVVLCGFQY